MNYNIAILGGGSWGTAVSKLLSENNHKVRIWFRNKEKAEIVKNIRENKHYLPDIKIPENILVTSDIHEAVKDADIIVLAVPTQEVRGLITKNIDVFNKDAILVNLSKGLEKDTLYRISQVCEELLPNNKFVALSGPSHAEEVALEMPTTVVAASSDEEVAKLVQDVFMSDYFRVYINTDIIGVEIGGALKNVIALAVGISNGLGFGDNTKAALINRGIHEIARLAEKMGADKLTFLGLSGIGDLVVTCTSVHSRNRKAGILIGKGYTKEEAAEEVGMVVEGIITTHAAYQMAKNESIEMPIVNELYSVLYLDHKATDTVDRLMKRNKKHELN
jgi:glycerol-3-phosphate dehydrogenase (NAD(P)+)